MKLSKIKRDSLIFLTILIINSGIAPSLTILILSNRIENSSRIRTSQAGDNFTVSAFLPKLIWIEAQLNLNITSNETGQIFCVFFETSGQLSFNTVNRTVDLIGGNASQGVIIKSKPDFFTFPGVYQFTLNITGQYIYSESFEVIFAMGYSLLILFLIIFIVSLIIIITRKSKVEEKKAASVTSTVSVGDAPAGKIKCPECHKAIEEGLTFCPDCGARIPEFLRYNPNTSGI